MVIPTMWITVCGSDSTSVKLNLGPAGRYPQDERGSHHRRLSNKLAFVGGDRDLFISPLNPFWVTCLCLFEVSEKLRIANL